MDPPGDVNRFEEKYSLMVLESLAMEADKSSE